MPGAYKSLFVIAFDLDRSGQAIPVSEPKLAPDETAALAEARRLAGLHAGVSCGSAKRNLSSARKASPKCCGRPECLVISTRSRGRVGTMKPASRSALVITFDTAISGVEELVRCL